MPVLFLGVSHGSAGIGGCLAHKIPVLASHLLVCHSLPDLAHVLAVSPAGGREGPAVLEHALERGRGHPEVFSATVWQPHIAPHRRRAHTPSPTQIIIITIPGRPLVDGMTAASVGECRRGRSFLPERVVRNLIVSYQGPDLPTGRDKRRRRRRRLDKHLEITPA